MISVQLQQIRQVPAWFVRSQLFWESLAFPAITRTFTCSTRFLAKDRGGKKAGRIRQGGLKVKLSDEELSEVMRIQIFRRDLEKAINHLAESYTRQLNLANSTASLESLDVDIEGETVQLREVAQIQKRPNLVVLNFTSFPDAIKPAVKAIETSGLRAGIQQDASTIFLHLPRITREQREDFAKSAKTLYQKCKDNLIQVERRATKEIQGSKQGQSADLIFNATQQIKFEVEDTIRKAEDMMKMKQKELLNES